MDIGKNIREAREAQGLLVSEVARRAGLTISGVQFVEEGRVRNPTVNTVVKISRALGVAPGELLKETTPAPKVVALPSTPLIDSSPEELDRRLRELGSAQKVEDEILDRIREEQKSLRAWVTKHVSPKLRRADVYYVAATDYWSKLADPRDVPFKSVMEIAQEMAGTYDAVRAEVEDSNPGGGEQRGADQQAS